jgi:hypothetical protein
MTAPIIALARLPWEGRDEGPLEQFLKTHLANPLRISIRPIPLPSRADHALQQPDRSRLRHTTGGLNLERWTRLGAVSVCTGPVARYVVSRSLASASRAGFGAAAAGILGKLPARCALSAPARRRRFVELGTAARRRMISASRKRLGENCVSARPGEAVLRPLPAAEHAGCDALARKRDRKPPATPLAAAAVFGISPSGNPEPLKLSAARPLWWTEGAPRVPFPRLPISVKPRAALFAGMLDVGTSIPQAGHFGLL